MVSSGLFEVVHVSVFGVLMAVGLLKLIQKILVLSEHELIELSDLLQLRLESQNGLF